MIYNIISKRFTTVLLIGRYNRSNKLLLNYNYLFARPYKTRITKHDLFVLVYLDEINKIIII